MNYQKIQCTLPKLFKISRLSKLKNIPPVFYGRRFFAKPPPPETNEGKIRQVNRIAFASYATIALTIYMLFKNNNDHTKNMSGGDYPKPKPRYLSELANSSILIAQSAKEEDSLRKRYNFINKVVDRCASAVFYLEIRDPYKKDLETGEPMITSNGSGFLISEDGWALTNAHVVLNKPQSTITAIMRDGTSYKVQVEDADMNIDIALLKLETNEKLPSLEFGEIGDACIGEWVVALGSPLSLSNSVTVGIISCVNRPAQDLGLKNYSMTYIQTDASITFGNSGGPLVNLDGNVIGINNLRLTSGISFAIPVEYAKKFLENSKYRVKSGKSIGPMGKTLFGITTIPITSDLVTDLLRQNTNVPKELKQGLLVWKVIQDSPAARAGLQAGDIITHINGIPVKQAADLYSLTKPEENTKIALIHEGQKKNIILTADGIILT